METGVAGWASLAPLPIQEICGAVTAPVFVSVWEQSSQLRYFSPEQLPLAESCDAAVQVSTAALCQEPSLKMTILQANRLLNKNKIKRRVGDFSSPLSEP